MTTMPDQDTSTEPPKKKCISNRLHFHFEMGEKSSGKMAEKKAEQLIEQYFIDREYRYSLKAQTITICLSDGERIVGYRFTVEAWPKVDGEW